MSNSTHFHNEDTTQKSSCHAEERPRVSELWRLRNDTRNVVAYKCTVMEFVFKILAPIEASIIPLCDGTHTFDAIKSAFFDIYAVPADKRGEFSDRLDKIFERLMSLDGFLALEGGVSPSLQGPRERLIPDVAHYHFPAVRPERPLSVQIAFTNRCVCNCRYCYAERRSCQEAGIDQWRTVFDELTRNEIFLVDIAGGDLLTREDAFSILDEMTSRDFVFFLSTKSFISQNDAERLAEMGIGRTDVPKYLTRRVQVSVDSTDEEAASSLVRHPQYLQQAAQTARNLLQAGISPRIKCVITSFNADAPEKLVSYFADMGVTEFIFIYYLRSYYRHDDSLLLSVEQKRRVEETVAHLKSHYPMLNITFQGETVTHKPLTTPRKQWNSRKPCSGGRTNLVIQPNGDVTLCDQVPHAEPFVVGNVFNQGVIEVWKSQNLLDFIYPQREKFAGTVCFDCGEAEECMGPRGIKGYCFRDSLFCYGSIYDAPPNCPRQHKPLTT